VKFFVHVQALSQHAAPGDAAVVPMQMLRQCRAGSRVTGRLLTPAH
jgi:hypothetical protein